MNVKRFLFVTLFIVYGSSFIILNAQQSKIDSLTARIAVEHDDSSKVKTLLKLYDKYSHSGNPDKAMQCAANALAIAKTVQYKHGQADALRCVGLVYYSEAKYADALSNYREALKIEEDLKDTAGIAAFYSRISLVYFRQADLPEALQASYTGLRLREEIKDSIAIANSLINIGNVYSEQNDFVKALKTEKQALVLSLKFNQRTNIASCYNNIGGIYVRIMQYDSALQVFNKTIEFEEKQGDEEGIAIAYNNMGEIYMDMGKYDKALDYVYKSVALKKKIGYNRLESSYIHLAGIYNLMKQYRIAKLYADTSLSVSVKSGTKDYIQNSYANRAVADSGLGNYKEALADYQLSVAWHDSLVNDENTKKTVQAEMNFEFDRKQDAEKAEQDKKDLLQKEATRKQNITIYFISGFLLLVIVFAIFISRSLQQNRRKTVIISKQKEEVEKQNELIEHQKAIVEEKNKDITDSIKYASRIQRALLTTDEYIGKYVKENFILFKPRDIVSGDFYWAYAAPPEAGEGWGNAFYLACCDCTGHGVPGAFMSLLNISMLNESVIERKILRPDFILNDIRTNIIKALNPDGSDSGKDGMDCSLCMLDLKNLTLKASCANNPVWIIKKDKGLIEIGPDKMPVGIQHGEQKSFTVHTVQLNKGDIIYLFTDGYADQFGGPKGKKLKYKQLQEIIEANSAKPMAEQKAILEKTFDDWKGDLEQVDDVLIMGIRI